MTEAKRGNAAELLPQGYDVVVRKIRVGRYDLDLFRVRDPNALADGMDPEDFAEDERFPYWAELWPAGVALAKHIAEAGLPPGLEALELGCGTGIAGVTAALCGARVLFTDFEPEALAFARANHALNLERPGRTRLVDWRKPPEDLRMPLVLAADVLYEDRFLAPFVHTLTKTLAPGGIAYVAEPGRAIAEGPIERLEEFGFERRLHLEEIRLNGRCHAVWIHEIRHP